MYEIVHSREVICPACLQMSNMSIAVTSRHHNLFIYGFTVVSVIIISAKQQQVFKLHNMLSRIDCTVDVLGSLLEYFFNPAPVSVSLAHDMPWKALVTACSEDCRVWLTCLSSDSSFQTDSPLRILHVCVRWHAWCNVSQVYDCNACPPISLGLILTFQTH